MEGWRYKKLCKGYCQRSRVNPGGADYKRWCDFHCEIILAIYSMLCIFTVDLISEKKLSTMASSLADVSTMASALADVSTMASELADEDDEFITLLVNNLPVTGRKNIKAKTMLCQYCQQNNLPQPEYTLTLINPDEDEWRLFRARFTLNGKHVVGSGRTHKKAEMAAARKYLQNNFLSGESSPQAEIHVPRSRQNVPPKQLRKQQKRMEQYLARKAAESAAGKPEESEASKKEEEEEARINQIPVISEVDAIKEIDPGLLVYFDQERSTGSEASEIIQLAYCAQSGFGISNIFPKGKIDSVAARMSHKISIQGKHLVRQGEILPSMELEKACKEFLSFLRNLAALKGSKPVLVCHGSDMITLFNNMALVHLDKDLSEAILGAVDFLEVISDDENYPHDTSSMSLTKMNPQKLNLSETILGENFNREKHGAAHDALYDSKLLMRVVEQYCGVSQTLQIMVDTYMRASENIRRHAKFHLSTAKSRKKRVDQSKFYTFFGWEDATM